MNVENAVLIESSRIRESTNFLSCKFQIFSQGSQNQRPLGTDISNIDPKLSNFKTMPIIPKTLHDAELVIRDLTNQSLAIQEELDVFILENDRLKL